MLPRQRPLSMPYRHARRADASVLHVTAPAPYGGLEEVVHLLATGMVGAQHRVEVAAVLTEAGPNAFLDGLSAAGVTVHRIVTRGRDYVRQSSELTSLLRRVEPAVVHTHGYQADLLAGRAARRLSLPTVTTLHGFTGGDWKNRLYEWAQVRACRRFDRVVAVSQPMTRRLVSSGMSPERIAWIPNAWAARGEPLSAGAARAALGVHPGAYHLGWVGRMSREKGPDVLVEALGRMRDLPIVVSMIGDGPERVALERRATALGVDGRIVWQGVRADAWTLYRGFDLFVLSSRTEGTPMVLFEAASAGIPIVATAVGGVPDVLTHADALLVPAEDPRALAAAIRSACGDRAAADARASAALAHIAQNFAVGPWLDRYLDVYESLRA
jgi:glycosyltransferase involved in cell wall biosynthesis